MYRWIPLKSRTHLCNQQIADGIARAALQPAGIYRQKNLGGKFLWARVRARIHTHTYTGVWVLFAGCISMGSDDKGGNHGKNATIPCLRWGQLCTALYLEEIDIKISLPWQMQVQPCSPWTTNPSKIFASCDLKQVALVCSRFKHNKLM